MIHKFGIFSSTKFLKFFFYHFTKAGDLTYFCFRGEWRKNQKFEFFMKQNYKKYTTMPQWWHQQQTQQQQSVREIKNQQQTYSTISINAPNTHLN